MYSTPVGRAIVWLKRIALALDRMAPPVQRVPRKAEFSIATDADFERGYDRRTSPSRFEESDEETV